MAVLIEAFSVIAKLDALDQRYPGGREAYKASCPNKTFCRDDHLCRIGFMDSDEANEWLYSLQQSGLNIEVDGVFRDIALADNKDGLTAPCGWLETDRDEDGTLWGWLRGEGTGEKTAPEGWKPNTMYFADAEVLQDAVLVKAKQWWQFWR